MNKKNLHMLPSVPQKHPEACDLFNRIPREKIEELFRNSDASAELDFTFLGFEDVYKKVYELTNEDMVIVDLGCAYATQSWYFKDYAGYIGVDVGYCGALKTENSKFYFETIQSFIENILPTLNLDLNRVFAVCSAVPDKEARRMVRKIFPNYLDWYPGEEMRIQTSELELHQYEKEDV